GSECRIAPHRGGLVLSLIVDGKEVFYLDRETFDDPSKNVRGGVPLLFPICGPLQEGRYFVEGVERRMAQHGFARIRKWRAMETSMRDRASVTLEMESDRETHRSYPWDFRLDYVYQLKGRTLRLEQFFQNVSETPMPLQFGLHPYFLVGPKDRLELDIPATRLQDTTNWEEGPFSGRFDFNRDAIDVVFLDVSRREASLKDPTRGMKVTLRFDEAYRYLVFWTLRGREFVCLEPWSARRFALNTGEGLVHVGPGETFRTWVEFAAGPL
ncbi:MAG: aldose epimerase, partial [Candidatus Eremiobacterota bacterium]